ncbi:MAG: glycosyltransferase [Thermodesulfobacteriota bacterium]
MEISVIIPTLNEEENIEELLQRVKDILLKQTTEYNYEIIVVDGGSKDNTQTKALKCGAIVIQQKKPGYGEALKEGFNHAKGDILLTMDADFSHDPKFIELLLSHHHEAELIIASRYIDGGHANMPLLRKILSVVLNKVFTIILELPYKDISSGFRLYNKKILREINLTSQGYEILEEIIIKTHANAWSVMEIPFHYYPRKSGKSHVKFFKFAISYLKTLFKMWQIRNSLFSADYEDKAYNSSIPLQRYWQREKYLDIINFLGTDTGRILNIGYSVSKFSLNFPNTICYDFVVKKLRYLKKTNLPVVAGNTDQIPFKDKEFDFIICSSILEHIPEDDFNFNEINRVLKEGGCLIICTPDYKKILWHIIEKFYEKLLPGIYAHQYVTKYTKNSLIERLKSKGFVLDNYRYVFKSELILKAIKN